MTRTIEVPTRPVLYVAIEGRAVPQGSMRAFARNGRAFTVAGNAGRLERWRGDVRTALRQAMKDRPIYEAPMAAYLDFGFRRPASHLTSKGALRAGAPSHPREDIDKLVRSILDAGTGIVYADDSQVVRLTATKTYYADRTIVIFTLGEGNAHE